MQSINFSRNFARRMALLAVSVGCIVCFVLPATYFYMSLADKKNQAVIRGEVLAKSLESTVKSNLELWYYDVPKFVEIAGGISLKEGVDAFRIYDEHSRLIYEKRFASPFGLQFEEKTAIRYNNRIYGYVLFEYGLTSITYTTALLLIGFFFMGLLISGSIFFFPIFIVRKAEQEVLETMKTLEESEARYRAVVEQSPEAIVLVDPLSGKIIEANARFTERFGYDLRRDTELTLHKLLLNETELNEANPDAAESLQKVPLQRRLLVHKTGCAISVERSAQQILYRNRQLLMMVLRDVSEEVRREVQIKRDAHMATRVQAALLSNPQASEQIDISILYHPLTYVGGDLYFLDWRYRGQVLRGFLIDACGHGLGTSLHTAALHVLIREVNELDLPLAKTMRWLNRRTCEYFEDSSFAGALVFELDIQTGELRWSCAGIPEFWVSTTAYKGPIAKQGLFLSINEDEFFEMHTMPFSAGDCFYFMTDGLSDIVDKTDAIPLENFAQMVQMLKSLAESDECRDDATALCINVKALLSSSTSRKSWPCIIPFSSYGDYQRLKNEVADIIAEVTGQKHSMQEVAVNEALVNALECRDGYPRQHKAQVRLNKHGRLFVVRIKTSRIGFAGNAILRRLRSQPKNMFAFGEDASMGRGLPIMLSLSHRMIYNSEGTELLLAWKL